MPYIRSPKDLALMAISQRKALKLSQLEVGQLVGLQQKTISAFENKPEGTQLETLFRILSALELDITISAKHKNTDWDKEW